MERRSPVENAVFLIEQRVLGDRRSSNIGTRGDVASEYSTGWLCFASDGEKRRLVPGAGELDERERRSGRRVVPDREARHEVRPGVGSGGRARGGPCRGRMSSARAVPPTDRGAPKTGLDDAPRRKKGLTKVSPFSMEARGFEPRSETRSTTASTCVFH